MSKARKPTSAVRSGGRGFDRPDLHTQLESLLDQVWRCEADWRLFDRIDAFCASEPDNCGVRAVAAKYSPNSRR